jgi:hypothetical protein
MSIVHLRQINAHLEGNYRAHIDLSDVSQKSVEEQDQVFRTRALAAYALKTQAEVSFEISAQHVTDGYGDNGLDAVYFNRSDRVLYLVQSKWSQDGSGSISVGDMQKFLQGFKDLINARYKRFNNKVQGIKTEIDQALNDAKTRLVMIVTYTGTHPLSAEVEAISNDLAAEINDTTEILIFKTLRQSNIYSAVARGAEAQPIDLELALHSWGQVREPYLAYYGQVSASEVAAWWHDHFPQIFSPNIRVYLGSTEINDGITDAVMNSPEKFWYFNNGITALCSNISRKPIGGAGRDMGVFECEDFKIVNGAQTVGSIAAAFDRSPENIANAKVPIRIISLSDTPEEFGKEITKNNNTQNRIDRRDFVALDENQERIRNELLLENVAYIYKSGDSLPPDVEGFDLVEATVALACAHSNFSHSVQAKREIGRLWDDISKAPYRALFHDGISGPHLWRLVLLLRIIDGVLDRKANTLEGRTRLCAIHGNRLISHIVYRQLPSDVVSGSGRLNKTEPEDAAKKTQESYENVFATIEAHYPDSYPASLFKNQTKCADIIEKATAA